MPELIAEKLDDRQGLAFIGHKALPDNFKTIIFTLNELAAAAITNSSPLWRLQVNIVERRTSSSSRLPISITATSSL
jgi:hypothetical protein